MRAALGMTNLPPRKRQAGWESWEAWEAWEAWEGHQHLSRKVRWFRHSPTGTQEQKRFLSPHTLSMRPTLGQNLCSRSHGAGNAAVSRE